MLALSEQFEALKIEQSPLSPKFPYNSAIKSSLRLATDMGEVLIKLETGGVILCGNENDKSEAIIVLASLSAQQDLKVLHLSSSAESSKPFYTSLKNTLRKFKVDRSIVRKIKSNIELKSFIQFSRQLNAGQVPMIPSLVISNDSDRLLGKGELTKKTREFINTLNQSKLVMMAAEHIASKPDFIASWNRISNQGFSAYILGSKIADYNVEVKFMGLGTHCGTHFISPVEFSQRDGYLEYNCEAIDLLDTPRSLHYKYSSGLSYLVNPHYNEFLKHSTLFNHLNLEEFYKKCDPELAKFKSIFQELQLHKLSIVVVPNDSQTAQRFARYLEETSAFEPLKDSDTQRMKGNNRYDPPVLQGTFEGNKRRYQILTWLECFGDIGYSESLNFFTSPENRGVPTPIVELMIINTDTELSIPLREIHQLHMFTPMCSWDTLNKMIEQCTREGGYKDFTQLKVYSHAAVCFPSKGMKPDEQDKHVCAYTKGLMASDPRSVFLSSVNNPRELRSIDLCIAACAQRKLYAENNNESQFHPEPPVEAEPPVEEESRAGRELDRIAKLQESLDRNSQISTNETINNWLKTKEKDLQVKYNKLLFKETRGNGISTVYYDLKEAFDSINIVEELDM